MTPPSQTGLNREGPKETSPAVKRGLPSSNRPARDRDDPAVCVEDGLPASAGPVDAVQRAVA